MPDEIFDSESRNEFPPNFDAPKVSWKERLAKNKFWLVGWSVLLIVALIAAVWFYNRSGNDDPTSSNVILTIKGPETLASGNEIEYRIIYKNGENADLINVSMEVFYPPNFKFKTSSITPTSSSGQRFDLPVLRQGQENEVKIRGKLTGATGDNKDIRARLLYKLSNFNSEFAVEQKLTTTILAPNLELEVVGPIDVINGQDTTFSLNYKNVSSQDFDAAALSLSYPEGFKFRSASPPPAKSDNYWTLGKLAPGSTGKVEITGSFLGESGKEQLVFSELGFVSNNNFIPQINSSAGFKIVPSSLTLIQTATPSDVVNLGQTVNYSLEYGNFGSVGMTNVVVVVTVEGVALDIGQIRATNAILTGNTITWKSATLNNLALLSPNQKGTLNFSVKIKPSVLTNLKNQTIKSTATIYSDQVKNPIRAEDLELKLASELNLIVSGDYVSGALPMEVGKTTAFNITFLISNLSNDLTDGEVIASMPLPSTAWQNIVIPDAEKNNVTFDSNSNKIKWKLGNVPAFVGRFSPARIMTFQLHVTPTETDRGRTIELLSDIKASAIDSFTLKTLESTSIQDLTVSDLGDDQIDAKGSTVE